MLTSAFRGSTSPEYGTQNHEYTLPPYAVRHLRQRNPWLLLEVAISENEVIDSMLASAWNLSACFGMNNLRRMQLIFHETYQHIRGLALGDRLRAWFVETRRAPSPLSLWRCEVNGHMTTAYKIITSRPPPRSITPEQIKMARHAMMGGVLFILHAVVIRP